MNLPVSTIVTTALAGLLTAGGIGIFTTHTETAVNSQSINDLDDRVDKLELMANDVAYIRAYVEQQQLKRTRD